MNELRHGLPFLQAFQKIFDLSFILYGTEERRAPSSLSHHFPLWAEEGVALERFVLVGGDEGEHAVVRRVRRAVGDPEMELKMTN